MVLVAHKVREAKKRARERAIKERQDKAREAFRNADKDGTGKLNRDEVRAAIAEVQGEAPLEEEVTFIMRVSDTKPPEGKLGPEEFAEAMDAWVCYQEDFQNPDSDLSAQFDEFDKDQTGSLDREQVKALLTAYQGSGVVTEEDVDYVIGKADIIGDGKVNKIEMRLALASWFQRNCFKDDCESEEKKSGCGEAPPPPKSKACTIL